MPLVYLEVKIVAYDTEVNLATQQCLTSLDSQWNKVCSTENYSDMEPRKMPTGIFKACSCGNKLRT